MSGRARHTRTPSVDGESRRASSHSLNYSFAYGAPASPHLTASTSTAHLHQSPQQTARQVPGAVEEVAEEVEQGTARDTGRASEPASVRYARLADRKRDTGGNAYPPPKPVVYSDGMQNTSVNIANAFKAATNEMGGAAKGGRKEDLPATAAQEEREDEEQDDEEDDVVLAKPAAAPTSAGKKRKKHAPKDPTYRHQPGQSSSSEESEHDQQRGKQKRTKVVSDDNDRADDPAALNKPRRRSHRPADPTYRPMADPSFRADDGTTSDSEGASPRSRRKSKGKARTSTSGRSAASEAIPRGIRDSEVWYGKKRKGRKGSRRSSAGHGEEDEEEEAEEDEQDGEGEVEDLGGMDPAEHDAQHDASLEDAEQTPPATSYFLRLKSPSPGPSAASTSQRQSGYGAASTHSNGVSPDPAFAAFDRSLDPSTNGQSLSASFDDSVLRGSSYDYSEEERIVQALEEHKKRQLAQQQRQPPATAARQVPPQTPGFFATPIPYTGAYPHTPAAAGASPVSALRKRRLPGPPSMLGAGTPLGAGDDDDDAVEQDEAARLAALEREGSRFGRKCGSALGPVVRAFAALWHGLQDPMLDWRKIWTAVDRDRSSHDRAALSRLATQLDSLESTLSVEQSRVHAAFDKLERSTAQHAGDAGRAVQRVKDELESLQIRLKALADAQSTDALELLQLQGSVSTVTDTVAALKAQVSQVAKDVQSATSDERITQLALDAIAQKLPGKVAVQMDRNGRLEIDPAFWRVLKDAFVDKKAVEKTLDSKLAALDGPKRGGLFGGSAKDAKPQPSAAAPPSWDDFLAANEDALKAWVASDLSSRTGGDAFISRQTFLDLLRREIKTLKRDFESKANENFEQMGQELLAKVAKQDDMRRKNAAYARPPVAVPGSASPITIQSSDGQNVTAVISSLVDSALLRYSKDVLARPDYALYTAGGRVIRSLTSETYDPHPLGVARSALAWVTGSAVPRGRAPVTALHPDTSPGSCWSFAGQHGQLGVLLSRRIVPTDITLEHISRDVALDGDVRSAPKDFEVWGIVDGAEHVAKVAQFRQEQLATKRAARDAGASSLDEDLASLDAAPASLPPSANHLLLAAGTYDPSAPSPVQSFPVTSAARQLGIPVQVVVVKVLSNHGESAYTCMYRVRVSGSTEAQLDAASQPAEA
ncbi:hypothetical protein Rhopal_000158-T1 [Rhodotorula paludigena]|uniref:SUN domain-containing protein n=1 Tax=Rhodotorula paludigena TaxID=86838 RepID=A0AAV5GA47_9BASI|nr:hypothetical protein Rhopal_000158-T1 [Rhodotorula paludigena]